MNVFLEFALTSLISIALMAVAIALLPQMLSTRSPNPNPSPTKQTNRNRRSAADTLFTIFASAYALVFGGLAILKHLSLHTGGFDLGIFDQIVWNSLHGRLFQNSISVDAPISLAQRFSPILLALVPLYALWSDPIMLLITQTIALTVSAFPLFWYARARLGATLALTLAGAYFLSPALQSINLWEFHEVALATPLLAFARKSVLWLLR